MRYRINGKVVESRVPRSDPGGPIVPYLQPFCQALSEQGYERKYLQRKLMLATCFSHWLNEQQVPLNNICSTHASRYLRYRYRSRRPAQGDRAALDHLISFLGEKGVLKVERIQKPAAVSAEGVELAYEEYLRKDRALSELTIRSYAPFVVAFLSYRFGESPVRLSSLKARDVVQFVKERAHQLHRRKSKMMTSALRSFLRYASLRGRLTLDLVAAVPTVANWSMPAIPRAISLEQTAKLLSSVERTTPAGRRDYAILLLLARLGLRAGSVATMELDDVDWSTGALNVRGKGGHRTKMPIPAEVGKAIALYLRRGRPECSSRRVFVRSKAPIRGFTTHGAISSIVRRHLMRAGIDAPTYGAHQFRHGLASDMLRHGASLGEIGAMLDHKRIDTTRIYTKVDLSALRTLAQPWPGADR